MKKIFMILLIANNSLHAMNGCDQLIINSRLHKAILGGNVDLAHQLLHEGAQTDSKDTFGLSPLHLAVMARSCTMVRLLLHFNAPLNAQDILGNTALDVAKKINNPELVAFLSQQQNIRELFAYNATVAPFQQKQPLSASIRPYSPPNTFDITHFLNASGENDNVLVNLRTGQITTPTIE